MRPKKYPYSGAVKAKKTAKEDKPELVVFPNVSFRKELLKHVFSVVKQHDNATIIYFRVPKVFGFGYDEERAKVALKYEDTLKILNSY
jgi:DNA polymerase elongation subunit (family B)